MAARWRGRTRRQVNVAASVSDDGNRLLFMAFRGKVVCHQKTRIHSNCYKKIVRTLRRAEDINVDTKLLTRILFVDTTNHVVTDFDPHKNAANLRKHGIALADSIDIEWDVRKANLKEEKRYAET